MTVRAFMANKKTSRVEGLERNEVRLRRAQARLPPPWWPQAQPQVRGARVISRRVGTPGAGRKSAPRGLGLGPLLEQSAVSFSLLIVRFPARRRQAGT